jgi:hypothetical protein
MSNENNGTMPEDKTPEIIVRGNICEYQKVIPMAIKIFFGNGKFTVPLRKQVKDHSVIPLTWIGDRSSFYQEAIANISFGQKNYLLRANSYVPYALMPGARLTLQTMNNSNGDEGNSVVREATHTRKTVDNVDYYSHFRDVKVLDDKKILVFVNFMNISGSKHIESEVRLYRLVAVENELPDLELLAANPVSCYNQILEIIAVDSKW